MDASPEEGDQTADVTADQANHGLEENGVSSQKMLFGEANSSKLSTSNSESVV